MHVEPAGGVSGKLVQQVDHLVRPVRVGEVGGGKEAAEKGVEPDEPVEGGKHPLHVQEGLRAPDLQLLEIAPAGEVVPDEVEVVLRVREALCQHVVNGLQALVLVDVAVGAVEITHRRGV